ncbi:MAG: DUF2080 family transposase-associated protein, partial [Thermoplasmata archaeon]
MALPIGLLHRIAILLQCGVGMTEQVVEKPMEIKMEGYEVVEKVAKKCATSARVLVPKSWIGKRV